MGVPAQWSITTAGICVRNSSRRVTVSQKGPLKEGKALMIPATFRMTSVPDPASLADASVHAANGILSG